jgi:hypothetical protein
MYHHRQEPSEPSEPSELKFLGTSESEGNWHGPRAGEASLLVKLTPMSGMKAMSY